MHDVQRNICISKYVVSHCNETSQSLFQGQHCAHATLNHYNQQEMLTLLLCCFSLSLKRILTSGQNISSAVPSVFLLCYNSIRVIATYLI